jgi:catechol 2,3-dioxygenase-like lactoylglutathione lyase family enzyme
MGAVDESGAGVNSWPGGIYAITLFVEDLDSTKEFYQTVFELPIVFEDDNSAVFQFGSSLINLLKITEADGLIAPAAVASPLAGSRFVFTLHVADVDIMCKKLITRGVELLNGPIDRPWGIRTANFKDPGGYIWEIAH